MNIQDINNIREQFEEILKGKKKEDENINAFNTEIGIINSKRDGLWTEIRVLFKFLKKIGNTTEIIYEEFTREKIMPKEETSYYSKYKEGFERVLKQKNEKKESKKEQRRREQDEVILNSLWNIKIAQLKNNLSMRNDYLEDVTKIAEKYRNTIQEIIDCIKDKICTEIEKDKFYEKSEEKYYLFVENTFKFYSMISQFFKELVLTGLISLENKKELESESELKMNCKKINSQLDEINSQRITVEGYLSNRRGK